MFEFLKPKIFYVQIYNNRLTIRDIKNKKEISLVPQKPFTTENLLIGYLAIAGDTLRDGLKKFYENVSFWIRPVLVLHPMEMIPNALSEIEEETIRNLGIYGGAMRVYVHVGSELNDNEVVGMTNKKYKIKGGSK